MRWWIVVAVVVVVIMLATVGYLWLESNAMLAPCADPC